jgi:hypothetical protein
MMKTADVFFLASWLACVFRQASKTGSPQTKAARSCAGPSGSKKNCGFSLPFSRSHLMYSFSSGHGFSRAEKQRDFRGFNP